MSIDLTTVQNYHDRSAAEAGKGYTQHLFRVGNVLQGAELNEVQAYARAGLKLLGDSIYKDGDIVSDASAIVDGLTGVTTIASGAVYLNGMVRGVPGATLTIPTVGTIALGVYLVETVITEADDATLLDPASETQGYNEPGAARLQVVPTWGYEGDGEHDADFFPIYYVTNGILGAKEAPPQLDSVTQAIAKYDRDSTGTSYIVSGLKVSMLEDDGSNQVYNVKDGRARVNGFGIQLNASRRLSYAATPDLKYIESEPVVSSTINAQRVNLNLTPIDSVDRVQITAQKTVTVVHGAYAGAIDTLPDTSVVALISVTQGVKTFVATTDFLLTAGKVDWTPAGAEPATGSSYTVTYQYMTTVTPTDLDNTGFTVTGAVAGSTMLVSYYMKMPRIDRLCLDADGNFVWVLGVSTIYSPVKPEIGSNMLALCQVRQTWDENRVVTNDGTKMVSMSEIEGLSDRLDNLTDLIAQQKLVSDLATREAAAKKGVFVDPFTSDDNRDDGQVQTAATLGYALTLAIAGDTVAPTADITLDSFTCDYTLEVVLSQGAVTGAMNINPYMAFAVPKKTIKLTPAIDRWTVTQTSWMSPETQKFIVDNALKDAYHIALYGTALPGWPSRTSTSAVTVLMDYSASRIEHLRQIEVSFSISGFGPGEAIQSMTFDGVAVTPTAI